MSDALKAFLSRDFAQVYAYAATPRWTASYADLDEAKIHPGVAAAIEQIVDAAHGIGNPGQRIVAVLGDAGIGKTHAISMELARLARRGEATPVVVQLSAAIEPKDISSWLVRRVFDELSSSAFEDSAGNSQLKRLAEALWQQAPDHRAAFAAAREAEASDEEAVERAAFRAASTIAAGLSGFGLQNDEHIVAGLLLRAEGLGFSFKAWINGSGREEMLGSHRLDPPKDDEAWQKILAALARLCQALQSPLVIAFDQIEATEALGSKELLTKLISYAVQLTEASFEGTAVVVSALHATYEAHKGELHQSFVDRLAKDPDPVILTTPSKQQVRLLLDRRAEALARRHGLEADLHLRLAFTPDWLLDSADDRLTPRNALELVAQYRRACKSEGRFIAAQEFKRPPDEPEPPAEEFDKHWQDKKDQATGGIRNFSDQQRLELLEWLIQHSVLEVDGLGKATTQLVNRGASEPTRVVEVAYFSEGGIPFERWDLAYGDAPVAKGRLRRQIEAFLADCPNAMPAVFTVGELKGIKGNEPDRAAAKLKRLVTGPAILQLLESGGRIAASLPDEWEQLELARAFVTEQEAAPGFSSWQQGRRFLTNEVEAPSLQALICPRGDGGAIGGARTQTDGEKTAAASNATDGSAASLDNARADDESDDPRDLARFLIGTTGSGEKIDWALDRRSSPSLPNFGLTVSGDAGQGKTQAIKAVIADAAALNCPILIFDFKNDYTGDFASKNDFTIIDLQNGLPFNPLRPPPLGPSGAKIISHIYEVQGVLSSVLGLGVQQAALLRDATEAAFRASGEPLDEWRDPSEVRAPSLSDVIAIAEDLRPGSVEGLKGRLGLLQGLNLLPSDQAARLTFQELMQGRFVLTFNHLPANDALKAALAELVLIQLQGYMLRGEQPRALRRLLVFDEAWRASHSQRLIELAREGRAFGVGVVVGTQFPDDLSPDLVGNLASKLYLYNSDAQRCRRTVQSLIGSPSGKDAQELAKLLASLQPFDAVFSNQQHQPYVALRVTPYFERYS